MWEWFIRALDNTNDFEGRARRMEYWSFVGGHFIIMLASLTLAGLLTMFTGLEFWPFVSVGFLSIVMLVPGLAVTVRRLHDTNRSGWHIMLPLLPFGGLVLLYYLLSEGTYGENRFGMDPKEELDLEETFLLEAPPEDEMDLEDWRERETDQDDEDEQDFWKHPYN